MLTHVSRILFVVGVVNKKINKAQIWGVLRLFSCSYVIVCQAVITTNQDSASFNSKFNSIKLTFMWSSNSKWPKQDFKGNIQASDQVRALRQLINIF